MTPHAHHPAPETADIGFAGEVVVVTGGAGGLGRAFCRDLARRGAAVVVNDVGIQEDASVTAAEALADELRSAGHRAVACTASIATEEGGAAAVDAALTAFGSISAIIHTAGTWHNAYVQDLTTDAWREVLDVHLSGAFFVVRHAWPLMQAQRYGRVVFLSSSVGAFGRLGGANYAAAKAGLLGLSRALALEGDLYDIRVNCVLPNAVTGAFERPMPPEVRSQLHEVGAPLRSRREPERVVPLVTYLAARQCAVTGEAFTGGAAGRYGRVFAGLTDGWWSGDGVPTAEDIRDHLDDIERRDEYSVPTSILDELRELAAGMQHGR